MKIGVISDTHDNVPAIGAALGILEEAGAEVILHAGDYCAPFAMKRLLQTRVPVYGIFGNCDGERAGLTKLMPDISDGPRHLELGGLKVCMIHIIENLSHEAREASDVIVFGHTHKPEVEHRQGRLFVNPGECGGWVTGRKTVAVIDTGAPSADVLEIP